MKTSLPEDSGERKNIPMDGGCLEYFPAALAGVAKHSFEGNKKHNPGQPLQHSRGKSSDHGDCVVRHKMDISAMVKTLRGQVAGSRNTKDVEMLLTEANALSWRSLALSQELHEEFGGAPLAPGAVLLPDGGDSAIPSILKLKVGARVRVRECGSTSKFITGTVVQINKEEENIFTFTRDDGEGWSDPLIGTSGAYWNHFSGDGSEVEFI